MTAANENGGRTEARTAVALVPGASPSPSAYPNDNTLAALREADENATDGAVARCHGAEDEQGNGICEGDDVRAVLADAPTGERVETEWCGDCRMLAVAQGYVLTDVAPEVSHAS